MSTKEELLAELSRCVLEMEGEEVIDIAKEYAACGYEPIDGILQGLVHGMNMAAELYQQEEYYIPELLICSDTMYNGLDILKPLIAKEELRAKDKVIIGVVEGDTHNIGKNLVKIMLESAGYDMIDLGRDVPAEKFVTTAKEQGAKVIALSALLSTTMNNMAETIELLEQEGIRNDIKVIVGGAPVSAAFAKKIGADGYAPNATEAVKLVNRLLGV
jgi:dimethylamine corrinoid protein